MEQHDFLQGSPEWHAHRATHFNASDAPAMLGVSPYKTRGQLMEEMHTGITPDVDASTQRRFDEGHRFEALARPLAAKIIGKKLYPVVGSDGKYSASFDGLTMDDSINFEHKSLNDELRAVMVDGCTGAELPLLYRGQMEQQHKVSGAEKTLFMASKWEKTDEVTEHFIEDENGYVQYYKLIEERHCWYEPDLELRAKIIAAWEQFEKDLAEFVPVEVIPAAVGASIKELPALLVEVDGRVVSSNLAAYKAIAFERIGNINTDLQTDQDFADAKKAVTFCKDGEERLELVKSQTLAQTASIDELFRTVDEISAKMRETRLMLNRTITARNDTLRVEIVQDGKNKLAQHVIDLNTRLGKPYMPTISADFAAAIKGKSSFDKMRGAVADMLALKKIEANEAADLIQLNLSSLRELAKDHAFLFADTAQLVMKSNDDLVVLIKMRISEHAQAEEQRQEQERQRIRAEEEQRARDKVEAERKAAEKREQEDASELLRQSEEQAKQNAKSEDASHELVTGDGGAALLNPVVSVAAPVTVGVDTAPSNDTTAYFYGTKPTALEITQTVARAFKVHESLAIVWLRDADFSAVELKIAA